MESLVPSLSFFTTSASYVWTNVSYNDDLLFLRRACLVIHDQVRAKTLQSIPVLRRGGRSDLQAAELSELNSETANGSVLYKNIR